jgi:chromosome segregation ATPase
MAAKRDLTYLIGSLILVSIVAWILINYLSRDAVASPLPATSPQVQVVEAMPAKEPENHAPERLAKEHVEAVEAAAAAAAEARVITDEKLARLEAQEPLNSDNYIEKMLSIKTQEVGELNTRLVAMNSRKSAYLAQAVALDKEIAKLNTAIELIREQHISLTRQRGHLGSQEESYKMDEHKGVQISHEIESIEKNIKTVGTQLEDSESRLNENLSKQATIDAEIKTVDSEIFAITSKRNTVDMEILQLGNRYEEVRVANRAAAAAATRTVFKRS